MAPEEAAPQLRSWAMGDGNSGISESDAMELFAGLDDWLSRGGFLPPEWAVNRDFSERTKGRACTNCGSYHSRCP